MKGLSRERVVATALELLDEEGLAKLSMRRLGERLGVRAMSLYRYVANKEELLDALHGELLSAIPLPDPDAEWRAGARALAEGFREQLRRHPHALPLFATRPALAPRSLRVVERALELLARAGLDPAAQVWALNGLFGLVLGTASLHFAATPGVDPATLDPAELPRTSAIPLAGVDPEAGFAFALEAFLDGIARAA